jgi:WhiB family redox-sensing transcriptional regulator
LATRTRELDQWDDQALHEFVEAAMRSVDPLPDLSSLLQRPRWQRRAACRGKGVDNFFPLDGSSRMRAAVMCGRCPVAKECMDYALDHPSLKGIWAGTSERGRNRIRAGADDKDTGDTERALELGPRATAGRSESKFAASRLQ